MYPYCVCNSVSKMWLYISLRLNVEPSGRGILEPSSLHFTAMGHEMLDDKRLRERR